MPTKIEVVTWDSCVFLDYFRKTQSRFEFIKALIDKAASGELVIAYSAVVLTELLCFEQKQANEPLKGTDKEIRAIREFLDRDYMEPLAANVAICNAAQQLRNTKGVKLDSIDSIVLATSIVERIPTLLTYDGAGKTSKTPLLQLNNRFPFGLKAGEEKVRVCTPDTYWSRDANKIEMFGSPM